MNPEPNAGDIHLDDDEDWHIGADLDFYSVALHEIGHALGLGHSDQPDAVMYPYYRQNRGLTGEDIAALLTLYARPDGLITVLDPLTLVLDETNLTTPEASITLHGSAAGGIGKIGVSWTSSRGSPGLRRVREPGAPGRSL